MDIGETIETVEQPEPQRTMPVAPTEPAPEPDHAPAPERTPERDPVPVP